MPRKKASKRAKQVMISVKRSKGSRKASQKRKTVARKERQVAKEIIGHGKYKSKGIGKAMGGAGGAALATATGMPFLAPLASMAGSALGDFAESGLGSIIQKIFGSGKYEPGTETMPLAGKINRNVFMLPELGSDVEFGQDELGDFIRVVKREFIADLLSTTSAYAVPLVIPLTPCNAQMSPWMAQLANLFQEYSYDGLVFEFVSLASPMITGGAPGLATGGYVGFVTRDNPDLPAPVDKQSALELEHSQTAAPWKDQCHPVECAREKTAHPTLFVEGRSGLPLNASSPLYRHGVTYVVVGDQPTAGVKMGEVWAAQAIKVRFPSLDNPPPVWAHWSNSSIQNGFPFGSDIARLQRTGANSGILVGSGAGGPGVNTIQFPTAIGSDRWFLVLTFYGNVVNTGVHSYGIISTAPNITVLTPWSTGGTNAESLAVLDVPFPGVDVASRNMSAYIFKVARVAAGVTTTNSVVFAMTATTAAGFGDLVVAELMGPDLANGLFMPKPLALVPYEGKDGAVALKPPSGVCGEVTTVVLEKHELPSVYANKAFTEWRQDYPTATPDQQLALTSQLAKVVSQYKLDVVDRCTAEKLIDAACSVACLDHC